MVNLLRPRVVNLNRPEVVNLTGVCTKEIKVENNNWPDYVFESSYKLRPLSQVEYFIKSNGRLPEMPSAREVKENGLEVGANQAMLLKKIEELTLYIIEQEKQMKNYCEELAEVKTELRKLRRKG